MVTLSCVPRPAGARVVRAHLLALWSAYLDGYTVNEVAAAVGAEPTVLGTEFRRAGFSPCKFKRGGRKPRVPRERRACQPHDNSLFDSLESVFRLLRAVESFELRVDKQGPNDCWEWRGRKFNAGKVRGYEFFYGTCRGPRNTIADKHGPAGAHRVAYIYFKGDIPPGLTVDHLCFNPLCVNPAHLDTKTPADNARRHSPAWYEKQRARTDVRQRPSTRLTKPCLACGTPFPVRRDRVERSKYCCQGCRLAHTIQRRAK